MGDARSVAQTWSLPYRRLAVGGAQIDPDALGLADARQDTSAIRQIENLRTLRSRAERRRFQFVVLFIHRDYDALWDKIKAPVPELFIAWRDCGLLDERGQARPAYPVWREFFERPLVR